jgi:hypothetical protein
MRWLPSDRRDKFMRYIFLALLLLFVSTLTACSFSTDFVIVNASHRPVEVKYKIGATSLGSLDAAGKPATIAASQMSSREWRELSSTQYVFDEETRTVTVSLMPEEALRVASVKDWQEGRSIENFMIREVDMKGVGGERVFKGDQVYKSFVAVPKSFLKFGPPASAILTYK